MPLIGTAFSALERLGGKPRELYTFARGGQMWRYTAASRAVSVTYGAGLSAVTLVYAPAVLARSRFNRSSGSSPVKVHLTIARTVPIAAALLEERMEPMYLGIHRQQDDPTSAPVLQAYGTISAVSQRDGWVEADLVSADVGLAQPFPRLLIERTCQWATYSAGCGVDEAAFSFETTIITSVRSHVEVDSVDGHADGYYDAGQLVIGRERVFIAKQIGVQLDIFGPMPSGVADGDAVTLIAGDDKSLATCKAKFDNVPRFLGFDRLPTNDPLQTGFL